MNVSTTGADTDDSTHDEEPPRGRGRNKQLAPPLQIPKNRSTASLSSVSEHPESDGPHPSSSRVRFSFDAGSGLSADYDSITRCDSFPLPPSPLSPLPFPPSRRQPKPESQSSRQVTRLASCAPTSRCLGAVTCLGPLLPTRAYSGHASLFWRLIPPVLCLVICCLVHLSTSRSCVTEKRNHTSCT